MTESPAELAYSDYTVGWICALPETELVAAMAMLDKRHLGLPTTDPNDANSYVLGRIGDHNVVIACLPAAMPGKVSAATVAKDMIRSFPAVRFGLMVGIGGGAPYHGSMENDDHAGSDSEEEDSEDEPEDIRDIRLGDVVVSLHSKSSDAVVQYDFGKSIQKSEFIRSGGKLNKPPNIVLSAVSQLQAQHKLDGHNKIQEILSRTVSKYPVHATDFQYPVSKKDRLFKSTIVHVEGKKSCKSCCGPQNCNLVQRKDRPNNSPQLHYGTIGSADQVMKDALLRDKWAREESIICFEMEAAGLMDSFPCLVIRGISDYADSHKNKNWQLYAAATAASYAKELLLVISGLGVTRMDPIKQIEGSIREINDVVKDTSAAIQNLKNDKVLAKLPYAERSSFDASGAEHDTCHPETRIDLLDHIKKWARNPGQECVFWLNGMAGTGKSTVSRTVAHYFKKEKQLGASFFFKREEHDRRTAKKFFTTVCAQLLLQIPTLIKHVETALEKDPYISGKSMKEQFDKLLLQPLLNLNRSEPTVIMIVIDALDECEDKDDIRAILQLLPQLQECKSIHLRVFLTSRPELPIRLYFQSTGNYHGLVLHKLSKTVIEKDIRVFLKAKFLEIKETRKIEGEWPGDHALETLVMRTVPLFISAATICRFVGDERWRPQSRLLTILQDPAATSGSQMDRTYLPVLNQLLSGANDGEVKQLKQEFQDIVGIIILLATPLSVNVLAQLINLPKEDISNRLNWFHSVLRVPEDIQTPIRLLHLSFRDYLLTTESTFHVDEKETHGRIASHCLHVMDTKLRHNICGLASYGKRRKDIDNELISEHLPAELAYSCHYWVYHLEQSKGRILESKILSFLKQHFLHWLEALSLIDLISEAVEIIDTLNSSVWNGICSEFSDFLYDARRFTLKFAYIASIAPLQLYCSGLVFSPMQSVVKKMFPGDHSKRMQTLPKVEDSWSPILRTLEGHTQSVKSVVLSYDGQTLASGSHDNTIKIWDVKTGTELYTLKGHYRRVNSIALSHDGQTLASGSDDNTIKIWDVKIGKELYMLKGHSHPINSVVFSYDGQTLASGSDDNTIKLWDVKTGTELRTLEGHTHSVNSVVFSYNGQTLASGSDDNTIKIWNVKTGAEPQTLDGHSHRVNSVVFSYDGQTLASGSHDKTIKIWDVDTGTELQTLTGHSQWAKSVAFSHDGQKLASGSDDCTIKIWDVKRGAELQTLRGHSDWVNSVAFSHDGQTLASGSHDKTIKIWDVRGGTELQKSEDHSHPIRSVAFSYDGETLASGSNQGTIKIWDVKTSIVLQTLTSLPTPVNSVAFSPDRQTLASGDGYNVVIRDIKTGVYLQTLKARSPIDSVAFSHDGNTLASGSDDKTIKIWDVKTGVKVQTLKGHSRPVNSVAFSYDGQKLASGSDDNTIKIWDVETGTELQTLKGRSSPVKSIVFSRNGKTLASGSFDNTFEIWDVRNGAKLQVLNDAGLWNLKVHSPRIDSMAFPQDKHIGARFPSTHLLQNDYDSISNEFDFRVSISNNWVALDGEELLWLPSEHRHYSCAAVMGAVIGLGYNDGRVSILGFRTL